MRPIQRLYTSISSGMWNLKTCFTHAYSLTFYESSRIKGIGWFDETQRGQICNRWPQNLNYFSLRLINYLIKCLCQQLITVKIQWWDRRRRVFRSLLFSKSKKKNATCLTFASKPFFLSLRFCFSLDRKVQWLTGMGKYPHSPWQLWSVS